MLEFIIFSLSTIGLTLIITQSYIFDNIRHVAHKLSPTFGKLLKCSQCSGMYSGAIIKTLLLIYNDEFIVSSLIIILIYGFIGSLLSYLTYLLIKPLMNKYD